MKLLLVGYYGFGNFGDELLCEKTQQLMQSVSPSTSFQISTKSVLKENHVDRFSICRMVMALWQTDVVVFGGGGIFQTVTSYRSLWYYLAILILAKVMRKPYWLIGQSIGPVDGWVNKKVTQYFLSRSNILSLRGKRSCYKGCFVSSDLGFFNEQYRLEGEVSGRLGMCLRKQWVLPEDAAVYEALSSSVGLICQQDQDVMFNESVQLPDCDHILSMIVSMRYHACVWAGLRGIPFIAVGDDDKLKQIAEELGQLWLPMSSVGTLVNVVSSVKSKWQVYRGCLTDTVPKAIGSFGALQEAISCRRY